jgi:hypothetical protein
LLGLVLVIIGAAIILIKKTLSLCNSIFGKVLIAAIGNTILHCLLYYSGDFFTSGCVFPIYFLITPLSYFGAAGVPLFLKTYPFLYFFLYQLIVYLIFQYRLLILFYFIYSIYCFLHIPIIDHYWDKEMNLALDSYIYKNNYIFPEHMFFINQPADIVFLQNFAKERSKSIIAGIGWYARHKEQLIEKNGIIIIDQNGCFNIFDKNHYLRFCETGSSSFYLSNDQNRPAHIFICSELFLRPIKKIDKEKNIIIASTHWTNSYLTALYKKIMYRIYDLMILE